MTLEELLQGLAIEGIAQDRRGKVPPPKGGLPSQINPDQPKHTVIGQDQGLLGLKDGQVVMSFWNKSWGTLFKFAAHS